MAVRKRVMFAATGSSSGKTVMTCACLQALKNKGFHVCAAKCGPDYIDPMFHRQVIGVESRNLDTYFTGEGTKDLLIDHTAADQLIVMEGVMGLYDGLGGVSEKASSYDLARITQTPVILIINAHGMGRSLIPLIAGFLKYDNEKLISGVILNRISEGFYQSIKPVIEEELSIRVLGYFSVCRELRLESRHLGLQLPDEIADLKHQLDMAAKQFADSVDMDALIEIAEHAAELHHHETGSNVTKVPYLVRIAVARDEAFCFYYEENLQMLRSMGAELVEFSPLHDDALPSDISGILLGGGYPELYAEQLSKNKMMQESLRKAVASGIPSLAECGGFMYLHRGMTDMNGHEWPMTGIIDADVKYHGKLVRFGYISLTEKESHFLPPDEVILGHEFHYYDSSNNGSSCTARKPVGTRSWDCVLSGDNYWWGFPHVYYPSNPGFAAHFIKKCCERREREVRQSE